MEHKKYGGRVYFLDLSCSLHLKMSFTHSKEIEDRQAQTQKKIYHFTTTKNLE